MCIEEDSCNAMSHQRVGTIALVFGGALEELGFGNWYLDL